MAELRLCAQRGVVGAAGGNAPGRAVLGQAGRPGLLPWCPSAVAVHVAAAVDAAVVDSRRT